MPSLVPMKVSPVLLAIACALAGCSDAASREAGPGDATAYDAGRSSAADAAAETTPDVDTDAEVDAATPPDSGGPATDSSTPVPPPRRFWWENEVLDPGAVPHPIWGDGHVHSNFSGDGNHPVLDMMNRAKALGADFVWITDHGRTPVNSGGISAAEFDVCTARGRDASDANQFAGCGVEYRLGYTRANGSKVYEAWHQIVHNIAANEFGEVLNVEGYTNWKAYQDDLARTSAYATLTHPSGPTPWYNDDDSAYRDTDPKNHPNVELIELNGGDADGGNGNKMVDGMNAYFRFLNDGWQISPVWNSDMHHFYSGPEKAKGYGAWIDRANWNASSYRTTLRTSARRHNTFANHPGNEKNYIRMLSLDATGAAEAMMGSTLPVRPRVGLRIKTNITSGNKRWHFRLFTNRNDTFATPLLSVGPDKTVAVSSGAEQQWELSLDTEGVRWIVVYASPETGAPGAETQYVVSAPMWLNNR